MNNKSKEDLLIKYSKSNNKEGVAELLNGTINVNHARYGYTALIHASKLGHTECVELLLKHPNINVNHATNNDGHTALRYASYNGNTECVELLLKHPNINVNYADNNG